MAPDAPDIVAQEVERVLDGYGITVSGQPRVEKMGDSVYEVAVPFEGELLFDDILGTRDLFLYDQRGRKILMIGVRDGQLLLRFEITWI